MHDTYHSYGGEVSALKVHEKFHIFLCTECTGLHCVDRRARNVVRIAVLLVLSNKSHRCAGTEPEITQKPSLSPGAALNVPTECFGFSNGSALHKN